MSRPKCWLVALFFCVRAIWKKIEHANSELKVLPSVDNKAPNGKDSESGSMIVYLLTRGH